MEGENKKTIKPSRSHLIQLEEKIIDLGSRKHELSTKKKRIENELSAYRSRIRSNGRNLPRDEYKDICRKQDELKRKMSDIEMEIGEVNDEKARASVLKEKIRYEIGLGDTEFKPIKERLTNLRDKYQSFSSDSTRVSSMRVIASQFVEELEAILEDL